MTSYQMFLLAVLVLWPCVIVAVLFLMSRLEDYVARPEASTPQEAGLEPVAGQKPDKEVTIVFGDKVISKAEGHPPNGSRTASDAEPRRVTTESQS